MIEKSLFDFGDYRAYLRHVLSRDGARSGLRTKFAQSLNCQSSYVSQVLGGDVHLSLEQAYRANEFLAHDQSQAHFFMLLVQQSRAGSHDLKKYFQSQIDLILGERSKIKNRVITSQELTESQQARYYSHSDYASVHMCLAVPKFQTARALVEGLGLSPDRVETILEFLLESGLAEKKNERYTIGAVHLHLGPESPFLQQHHINWRLEALKKMNTQSTKHLHYSATYSLSRKDFEKLRENLLQVIEKNLAVVRPSPEEIVVCQVIDLIPLSNDES
ncbi:MAG: TIGR02147 family protein [Bdellovibrionaceae bacterium]|nr:TIGR02147 family protein [Pseudobdellovibrionaceae bacterium]